MIATSQEHYCSAPRRSVFANDDSMDGLEEDRRFVRELCEWAGKKPSALAREAGVAVTTITRAHNGKAVTRMSAPIREKLKARFPRFPGFAIGLTPDLPDAPSERSYVSVHVLPSYAGMGGGGTGEGDRERALLPRALIEDHLRGQASDFELIDVRGDSMAPDFLHGDQILVDRRDRDPRQPGPFALWDGDGYVIKLVERVPAKRGWYRVFSTNERYTPYEVEEHETTIMGRPVWFARRL